ncbi:hypothetical protein [Streptomyces ipomoeae]|uniref:hypothetical protein n=1 Tax=Streptomyces ipomoeae TaxID=103232 RepID=UPI001146B645|nr:hypothetical protein [Streptomyces ipomoeae]MDX2935576.1 hypothetical protein [Streptomyces ipomoeae]TQE18391.1 hypothetical protein SipoB123_34110 [Streptomyces ipomoeae]
MQSWLVLIGDVLGFTTAVVALFTEALRRGRRRTRRPRSTGCAPAAPVGREGGDGSEDRAA